MADRPMEAFAALPDHWHTAIAEYTTHRIGCPADEGEVDCECAIDQFRDTLMVALAEHLGLLSRQEDGERKATPVPERLYVHRCGWCGAYEGTVDPTEPCARDSDTGEYIGPHQFSGLEEFTDPVARLAGSNDGGVIVTRCSRGHTSLGKNDRCSEPVSLGDGVMDFCYEQGSAVTHHTLYPQEGDREWVWIAHDRDNEVVDDATEVAELEATYGKISGTTPDGFYSRRPLQGEEDNQEESDG